MILKLLSALPEKWVRENVAILKWHVEQQCLYGAYPEDSLLRARLDFFQAWTEFLVEVCIALGSDIERTKTTANTRKPKW